MQRSCMLRQWKAVDWEHVRFLPSSGIMCLLYEDNFELQMDKDFIPFVPFSYSSDNQVTMILWCDESMLIYVLND